MLKSTVKTMSKSQSEEETLVISTPVFFLIILAIIPVSFLLFKTISSRSVGIGTANGVQNTQEIIKEEDGKQIITIQARGAYSPRTVSAKAGKPTILRMKTSNSYGCERAFSIPKMGILKSLPPTGETDIDLGVPEPGSKVFGTCSMGMYTVTLSFN